MVVPSDIHEGFPRINLADIISKLQDRDMMHTIYGSSASLKEIEFILKRFMTEEEFASALVAIRITEPLE